MSPIKNPLIAKIDHLEDELTRLKFEVIKGQMTNPPKESGLADRIVQEVRGIRRKLYQQKYSQKTARFS